MQVSNLILFGLAQTYILLIGVCIFLLMHTRTLKKIVRRLQERIQQLVQEVRQAKANCAQAQAKHTSSSSSYEKQINDQLLLTRKYHKDLNSDRDIALDLSAETPLPRQTTALRHAFLLAEKEALGSGENAPPNWEILQSKLSQLIQYYQSENRSDNVDNEAALAKQAQDAEARVAEQTSQLDVLQQELETSKKRIANLEKFKKLFFDTENKWKEAQEKAQQYHEQLSALAPQVDDQESYEGLLDRYNKVYNEVGELLQSGGRTTGDTIVVEHSGKKPQISTIEITRTDKRTADELKHLRKVAEEQHRLIHMLQQKLSKAHTLEQKNEIIDDLNNQLERQTRFVKESETCIKLLEDELSTSMRKVGELEDKAGELEDLLRKAEKDLEHIPKMKLMIKQFTEESKDMLQGLAALEKENEELLQRNGKGEGRNSEAMEQIKRELLTLQGQYTELEERYLEMKIQS